MIKLFRVILFISILIIFNIVFCVGQSGPLEAKAIQSSQDKSSVIIGAGGSTERIVGIDKIILPKKDFYFPGEAVSVFVVIKFFKYNKDPWELKNFTISELIDENLRAKNDSVRWAIINNVSEISKYKTSKFERSIGISDNVSWINNNFNIIIPNKISSTQGVVYWYNITLENTGAFNADTIICSGQDTDYFHPETSLGINVINYSFFSPIWRFLKEIIWILIAISGIFTFYNMITSRRRRPIYPDEFLRRMIKDLKRLLTSLTKISPNLIGLVSSISFVILSYSYLSSLYPQHYKPINLIIITYWDYISGIGPIAALLVITAILLIINKEPVFQPIRQTIKWITVDMPPLVAFILFMIIYSIPLILVIIMT